jgi:hypothetical protein
MNPITKLAGGLALGVLVLAALGCDKDEPARQPTGPRKAQPADGGNAANADPEAKKVLVAKNIYLETQGTRRRVVINAEVCLREGQLEQFLTRTMKKEHESVLAADVDARDIHKVLLLTGAEAGKPVTYQPMYKPASGSMIQVTVRYEKDGKLVTVPAQEWIRNVKSGKNLASDWVFAGSRLFQYPDEKDKPPVYLANDGDLICISNFETALLDLPIKSPKDNNDLVFEAHTERIPPKGTKVVVVLEPIPEKKP